MASSGFSVAGVAEKVVGGVLTALILTVLGAVGMGWLRVKEWWWAAPVMYGVMTATCLYILLSGLFGLQASLSGWWRFGILLVLVCMFSFLRYVDRKSLKPVTALQPVVVPQPASTSPPPPPPSLTWQQMFQLENIFLGIPRPCFVKITAAADKGELRQSFLTFLKYNVGSTRGGDWQIPACEITEDEQDKHPELYPDELKNIPSGIVVVSGGDLGDVKTLVEVLREVTVFKVRVGRGPQPDGVPQNWIHIEIGAGSLQR